MFHARGPAEGHRRHERQQVSQRQDGPLQGTLYITELLVGLEYRIHPREELGRSLRLAEIALDAKLPQHLTRRGLTRVARLQQDLHPGVVPMYARDELLVGHPVHGVVDQDELHLVLAEELERTGQAVRAQHLMAIQLQGVLRCIARLRLSVDNQDRVAGGVGRAGFL